MRTSPATRSRWAGSIPAAVHIARSDDNDTDHLEGRLLYRLQEWPYLGAGWRFRFADARPVPPEYPLPAPPAYPKELAVSVWPPKTTMLYNGLVYPLTPMAIRGAIWYQGCQNINDGAIYADKMQALLNGWRLDFQNPEMPFFFVQLAPYKHYKLPALWEAQQTFADANGKSVGMAVARPCLSMR